MAFILFVYQPARLDPAFTMSETPNVTVSGANTTAQLTAPAGKTSGSNFHVGRIQDDENPGDAVDLATNNYREDEWAIVATPVSLTGSQYEFRVVRSDGGGSSPTGTVLLDTYTLTPKWTLTEALPYGRPYGPRGQSLMSQLLAT